MASGNDSNVKQAKTKKLLLAPLFEDASVRLEPEEPQKVLVAGMAEARPTKEYPDSFFGRAFKILRGEFGTLFKSSLFFILFTIPFAVILFWFAGYYQNLMLSGTYNFMGGIGVGYPFGVGDSIAESVARLYWDVKEPVYMMLAATLILIMLGFSGLFYCAKRSFFQEYYKKSFRMYWIGFKKHWWRFLLFGGLVVLIGAAMTTSIMNLLKAQQLAAAGAGDYCAVVFSWLFGAPLVLYFTVVLALSVTYDLSVKGCFKDALVVIVNNPFSSIFVCAFSVAPLLLLLIGQFFSIIIYIVMTLVGFTLMALMYVALVSRGMTKCHDRKEEGDKLAEQQARRAVKEQAKSKKADYSAYAGKPANGERAKTGGGDKKSKKTAVPYQNPKKKKKK